MLLIFQSARVSANDNGGKPWSSLLIPHGAITEMKTPQGLAAAYTFRAPTGVTAR